MQFHERVDRRRRDNTANKVRKAVSYAVAVDLAFLFLIQPYRPVVIVGESMLPTLKNFQLVLAKRLDHEPTRGDVVVARWDHETLIKRVAGLGGDTTLPGWPKGIHLPYRHVYLLGDNSPVSIDSRVFGPLPDNDVDMVVVFPKVSS